MIRTMTFDHRRNAILELIKAAVTGQISVERATDTILVLAKPYSDAQWLPSDDKAPKPV